MNRFGIVAVALSLINASCSGLPTVEPTGRSSTPGPARSRVRAPSVVPATSVASAVSVTTPPTAPEPAASLPGSVTTSGTVGPLLDGTPPCFADRYPCETYDFSLNREGSIEVTMTWEGPPRAMLVQLYWAGEGLAHEDVAPRTGPSRIWFRRPLMEAADYRLRVVSLEPEKAIPFTLTLTH